MSSRRPALSVPTLLLLSGVAAGLLGCDKLGEKIAEKATEAAIGQVTGEQIDVSKDGVTLKSDDGKSVVQSGSHATVPSDWPTAFPLYPGAVLQHALSTQHESDGGRSHVLTFSTKDQPAKILEFYTDSLKGYKKVCPFATEQMSVCAFSKDKSTLTVTATLAGKEQHMQLAATHEGP